VVLGRNHVVDPTVDADAHGQRDDRDAGGDARQSPESERYPARNK
jgi:hypothetical protein